MLRGNILQSEASAFLRHFIQNCVDICQWFIKISPLFIHKTHNLTRLYSTSFTSPCGSWMVNCRPQPNSILLWVGSWHNVSQSDLNFPQMFSHRADNLALIASRTASHITTVALKNTKWHEQLPVSSRRWMRVLKTAGLLFYADEKRAQHPLSSLLWKYAARCTRSFCAREKQEVRETNIKALVHSGHFQLLCQLRLATLQNIILKVNVFTKH